jgi:hypothetical protein
MSARHQGSWQQFRAAVEELQVSLEEDEADTTSSQDSFRSGDLPLYQEVRFLMQRLLHADFFACECEDGWRVIPPVLAAVKQNGLWLGVLCGARSPRLLQSLEDAATGVAFKVDLQNGAPDRITLRASDSAELANLAKEAGIFFQGSAPIAILANLPIVNDPQTWSLTDLPSGPDWEVEQFSTRHLRWRPTNHGEALTARGTLFRFRTGFQRFYFFCAHGKAYRVNVQAGKYIALRRSRRKIIAYHQSSRRLSVPVICRPPPITERALILCSGLLPQYDSSSGRLTYNDIPQEVARLAAQILNQEVIYE